MFVADGLDNSRIVKLDAEGNYVTHWGSKGDGRWQFDGVHAVATDTRRNIYVADRNNDRVQVFNQTTRSPSSALTITLRHPVSGWDVERKHWHLRTIVTRRSARSTSRSAVSARPGPTGLPAWRGRPARKAPTAPSDHQALGGPPGRRVLPVSVCPVRTVPRGRLAKWVQRAPRALPAGAGRGAAGASISTCSPSANRSPTRSLQPSGRLRSCRSRRCGRSAARRSPCSMWARAPLTARSRRTGWVWWSMTRRKLR